MFSRHNLWLATASCFAANAAAQDAPTINYIERTDTGVSAIWIFANISYAAMRAQNHPSAVWRILAFIFGFPGTLLSFLIIREGEGKAYGIHFPKRPD